MHATALFTHYQFFYHGNLASNSMGYHGNYLIATYTWWGTFSYFYRSIPAYLIQSNQTHREFDTGCIAMPIIAYRNLLMIQQRQVRIPMVTERFVIAGSLQQPVEIRGSIRQQNHE